MRKMLSKARNMFGPVAADAKIVKAFERFMEKPTARRWDAICGYLITPKTTVWLAVLKLDSTGAPRVGATTDADGRIIKEWAFVPHPFTVRRAIDEALRKEGLADIDSMIPTRKGAFGGAGTFASTKACCDQVVRQKTGRVQYATVVQRINAVRVFNACGAYPHKPICEVSRRCMQCAQKAYGRGLLTRQSSGGLNDALVAAIEGLPVSRTKVAGGVLLAAAAAVVGLAVWQRKKTR